MNTVLNLNQTENILSEYKSINDELKALETRKDTLRKQIYTVMDETASDTLLMGSYKANRQLIVQQRFDSKKAREVLGEEVCQPFMVETEVVRLTVL